jgi:hypothetical protein
VTPAGQETFFERFAEMASDASPEERFRTLGSGVGMLVLGRRLPGRIRSSTDT